MTTALAAFAARHFGHPVVQGAMGDFDDADLAQMEGLIQMGVAPVAAAAMLAKRGLAKRKGRVVKRHAATHKEAQAQGLLGLLGMEDTDMILGDDWDDDDEREMAADEEEDEELGEDDEDVYGDTGDEIMGASVQKLEAKIAKLRERVKEIKAKLEATPKRRRMKRRRLNRRLKRVSKRLGKKEDRLDRKREKLARKLGIPAAALAAGAAGVAAGTAGAITAGQVVAAEEAINRGEGQRALQIMGFSWRTPPEGEELRLPFEFADSAIVNVAIAAGVGLRTVDIDLETDQITYADFEVLGVEVEVNIAPGIAPAEQLVNVQVDRCLVNGGIDLYYGSQSITMGAQVVDMRGGGSGARFSRTLPGLRDNPILEKNNTAELDLTFRQEIDNTSVIDATIQAALIVRRLSDPNAMRY